MPEGRDKGYDVFIETVKLLYERGVICEFHVAGGFTEDDIDLRDLKVEIKFHGLLVDQAFHEFLSKMDIIVSPNINDCLYPGAFDGFPTGSCAEAGLCGALIMCTDPLGNNNGKFINHEEIEIIDRDVNKICEKIIFYNEHRDKLTNIIRKQFAKLKLFTNTDAQMKPRINVLQNEIRENNVVPLFEEMGTNRHFQQKSVYWSNHRIYLEMKYTFYKLLKKLTFGKSNIYYGNKWQYYQGIRRALKNNTQKDKDV
jgi:hypothetical protein